MRKLILAGAAALAFGTPGVGRAQTLQPSILFVHGIPGRDLGSAYEPSLPIDLAIDGVCVKFAVDFASTSGPFPLASGNHTLAVSPANSLAPCGNAPLLTTTAALPNSGQIAIVAQETPNGFALSQYGLAEGLAVPAGQTRYLVVHAANAPAVDVVLTSTMMSAERHFNNLQPGQSATNTTTAFLPLPAFVYPHGVSTPVAGPVVVTGAGRSVVAAFVVGSAANGTVTIVRKEIPGVF